MANYFETDYYKNNNYDSKEKYRLINIFVFSVALIIYLYFFKGNYETVKNLNCCDSPTKVKFNQLNFLASVFIVIAGVILLYIAIFDTELETEIAFN